jgi:hypothetical protein
MSAGAFLGVGDNFVPERVLAVVADDFRVPFLVAPRAVVEEALFASTAANESTLAIHRQYHMLTICRYWGVGTRRR